MSLISLFETIKVVGSKPCTLFWIPASLAEEVADIPNGTNIFFTNASAAFINGPAISVHSELKNDQIELFSVFEF